MEDEDQRLTNIYDVVQQLPPPHYRYTDPEHNWDDIIWTQDMSFRDDYHPYGKHEILFIWFFKDVY